MTTRWARSGSRVLAAVSVTALVTAIPAVAAATDTPSQEKTTYDGEATAFQTTGLTLTLFPADEKLPAPFNNIPQPPEQVIELSSAQLGVPRQFGHAEYRGVDEPGSLPANPVLSGGAFRAASTKVGGDVVSEAIIGHLNIGGGQLTLQNVVARCTGDGTQIDVEAPLGAAKGQIDGEVELEAGTETRVPGIGRITWNDQTTDGATFGEVSNLVIDLDTNLNADVLKDVPEAMAAFEDVVQQVLGDLQDAGENAGLPETVDPKTVTGQPLYDALDDVIEQLPTEQLPDANSLLKLDGSITLASAACSQESHFTPIDNNPPGSDHNPPLGDKPPGEGRNEPPLADTGASPWPMRAGVVGLLAIATGGLLVLRHRGHLG
jgi:nucleotide-binding universal stress UspA family protein